MSKLILVGKKNGLKRYINKDVESFKSNEEAKKAVEQTKNDDENLSFLFYNILLI
jgi:hypothetical protein